MTRLIKVLGITGFAAVYLLQGACANLNLLGSHGWNFLPNINAFFANLLAT
jgi:hypothetical protein